MLKNINTNHSNKPQPHDVIRDLLAMCECQDIEIDSLRKALAEEKENESGGGSGNPTKNPTENPIENPTKKPTENPGNPAGATQTTDVDTGAKSTAVKPTITTDPKSNSNNSNKTNENPIEIDPEKNEFNYFGELKEPMKYDRLSAIQIITRHRFRYFAAKLALTECQIVCGSF